MRGPYAGRDFPAVRLTYAATEKGLGLFFWQSGLRPTRMCVRFFCLVHITSGGSEPPGPRCAARTGIRVLPRGAAMLANDGPSTSLTLLKSVSEPENDPAWDAGWAEFFKRYKPVIDAWCCTVGNHHEAEEVSSAVWEVLVKVLPRFV